MHTYRQRVFHPFNVAPEILGLGIALAFGIYGELGMVFGPLLGVIGLIAGSWLGTRLNQAASLELSATGLKAGGLYVPWSNIERLDRRPLILGGDRLVLREPIKWPRMLSLWPTRSIYVSMYERPLDIGEDIAQWAPHLLEGRDRAHA